MKTLLLVLAVVGLSGCAVYPAPAAYETYGYGSGSPYIVAPPVTPYGGTVYRYRDYNRDYRGAYPHSPQRRPRDSDRDGVPNGLDNCPTAANSSQLDSDADTIPGPSPWARIIWNNKAAFFGASRTQPWDAGRPRLPVSLVAWMA